MRPSHPRRGRAQQRRDTNPCVGVGFDQAIERRVGRADLGVGAIAAQQPADHERPCADRVVPGIDTLSVHGRHARMGAKSMHRAGIGEQRVIIGPEHERVAPFAGVAGPARQAAQKR